MQHITIALLIIILIAFVRLIQILSKRLSTGSTTDTTYSTKLIQRKAEWIFIEYSGALLSIFLAIVTGFLSLQLITAFAREPQKITHAPKSQPSEEPSGAITPTENSVSNSISPPKQQAESASASNGSSAASEPKDAIANAMTAVATSVAAVTLILSLGTSWFGQRLKEVANIQTEISLRLMEVQQQKLLYAETFEKYQKMQSQRDTARNMLIDCRIALHEWIVSGSETPERYSLFIKLSTYLESFMSADFNHRMEAFGTLITHLPGQAPPELSPIVKYTEYCHQLHGGDDSTVGKWTKIFSPVERQHYIQVHQGKSDFY